MIKTTEIKKHGGSLMTTIPAKIRELYGLEADDTLVWTPIKGGVHLSKLMRNRR